MAKPNKTTQGKVRLSVSLPVVAAFLFCAMTRPFLSWIGESPSGQADCGRLMPKLLGVALKFKPADLCLANNYLWAALYVISFAYVTAVVVVSISNFRNWTFEVLKAPIREIALLLAFLLLPGMFGLYAFIWGNIDLRIYGGPPENYPLAMDYAAVQIDILLYVVNLFLFVPTAVLLAMFIKRE